MLMVISASTMGFNHQTWFSMGWKDNLQATLIFSCKSSHKSIQCLIHWPFQEPQMELLCNFFGHMLGYFRIGLIKKTFHMVPPPITWWFLEGFDKIFGWARCGLNRIWVKEANGRGRTGVTSKNAIWYIEVIRKICDSHIAFWFLYTNRLD